MSDRKSTSMNAQLVARRDELRRRLLAIRRDLAAGLDHDMEDQAVQLENYDTLVEIARLAEEALIEVEAALQKSGSDTDS